MTGTSTHSCRTLYKNLTLMWLTSPVPHERELEASMAKPTRAHGQMYYESAKREIDSGSPPRFLVVGNKGI